MSSRQGIAPVTRPTVIAVVLGLALACAGCGRETSAPLVAPAAGARPTSFNLLHVAIAPLAGGRFLARIDLAAGAPADAKRYEYAIDPPAGGEPLWQSAASALLELDLARRERPYEVVTRAITTAGIPLPAQRISFTADNVIAQAVITTPIPTHQVPISTPLEFDVSWTGVDPEAPGGIPTGYLTRLVDAETIDPANPNGIGYGQLQSWLANDLATNRTAWRETADTRQHLAPSPPARVWYFAVAAKDAGGEPGAVESSFDLDRNVLFFYPTDKALGPWLDVFNAYFYYSRPTASLDPSPDAIVPFPSGIPMDISWSARPIIGSVVYGYRWALDLADVNDETPRRNANDLAHWSDWSLVTISTTLGPFPPADAKKPPHRFYLEARDSFDRRNLFVLELDLWHKAERAAPLLLVDDMYGIPSERNADGSVPYKGAYPMEAEQDSFYNAVGGVPDELRRHGVPPRPGDGPDALSEPGAFAGFDYDTLDYRFWPEAGISVLGRYQAVAWYTDQSSAARRGTKFGSTTPSTALRYINSTQSLNQLALYVAGGGKLWLFGDGATTAIANGYFSRVSVASAPRLPYTSGDDPRANILIPGDFLYDFCHLRSELNTAGTFQSALTHDQQLAAAVPYLPAFVGAAGERTARRWPDLPELTLAGYRGSNPNPALRSVNLTWVIPRPLSGLEGEGRHFEPVIDTLYLCRAITPDPDHVRVPPSDGFPNAIDYHGSEHGEVVWFGFPLYVFEPAQARQVVAAVMRVFAIDPLPAGVRQGPGAAEAPAVTEATAIDVSRPVPRTR